MKKAMMLRLCGALLFTGLVGACSTASTPTSETSGQYLDDASISTKVRAAIVGDKTLHITEISVETYKSVVQLSGFVDSLATKERAGQVAAGVSGVKAVKNNLVVK